MRRETIRKRKKGGRKEEKKEGIPSKPMNLSISKFPSSPKWIPFFFSKLTP